MTPHVGHFVVVLLSWQRVGGGVSGQDDLSHTRGRRHRYDDKHCTPRQKQGEHQERSHKYHDVGGDTFQIKRTRSHAHGHTHTRTAHDREHVLHSNPSISAISVLGKPNKSHIEAVPGSLRGRSIF